VQLSTLQLDNKRVTPRSNGVHPGILRSRQKFLRLFPDGFRDETYLQWERNYKWKAHLQWEEELGALMFRRLVRSGEYIEAAARAVRIEAHTNLLFSFEKMALRDAIKSKAGAKLFATGLLDFLHGGGDIGKRFERWCDVVSALPRRQTRVLTWPLVTVFGLIAQPDLHIFLKPLTTRHAASKYNFDFHYASRPSWPIYQELFDFADCIHHDLRDLKPRDMIDIQSFIWVIGSDEYANW
jgi:hypothetical protein